MSNNQPQATTATPTESHGGSKPTVLIMGATGFVGSHLAARLVEDGCEVRAGTRSPDGYDGPGSPAGLDVTDRGSVQDGPSRSFSTTQFSTWLRRSPWLLTFTTSGISTC